ncbi:copper homeostasis protein CutC [Flavobacterium sp. LS1P28]|uniref:copper homeostasis protein CutC n=1 Tax=unclassified Flavobacterium TaxID=196869 RepID=UPI000F82B92C|nr:MULTISPECIES: copper homeostasis protein CutC [unclassified Flavobacterium]RTY68977.1 copper homeostasis protein CutC [Flavobacterium sp. LB2P53]RTY74356.1 copper homeostasis protein CutC [Flavobacterium sp. LS1R10]RTY80794.1 copper homeostasis protein CutC [Flavobacterium sp. LS1P28]RTY91186.1 copper homeostasis protein CutC [Flavobacterium sp. RSP46]
MKKAQLEIACFNLESAIIAENSGADRVELCVNRTAGGTTPDLELTKIVRDKITIDLNVMIRPRGGNFVYSDSEVAQMKSEILAFKKLQVDGFVFGILKEDGSISEQQNKDLVALANPLPCTFHRAFDGVENKFQALESLIGCGFKTILTSGQETNVVDGIDVLAALVRKATDRIIIMPGGGLRSVNITALKQKTKAIFYHSSAIIDAGELANQLEIQALKANLESL